MRTTFALVFGFLLHLSCSRAIGSPSPDALPATAESKGPAALSTPKGAAAGKPPAPPSGKTQVDGGLPQIEPLPLKEGKRIRIPRMGQTRPLEITAAPDMRLEVHEQESLPDRVNLKGRDGTLEIFTPEAPWDSLADYLGTKSLDGAEVIHSQKLVRGFLVIQRRKSKSSPEGYRYRTIVSRPDLGVDCGDDSPPVTTRASIEKLASICLSVHEVGANN